MANGVVAQLLRTVAFGRGQLPKPGANLGRVGVAGPFAGGKGGEPPLRFLTRRKPARGATVLTG